MKIRFFLLFVFMIVAFGCKSDDGQSTVSIEVYEATDITCYSAKVKASVILGSAEGNPIVKMGVICSPDRAGLFVGSTNAIDIEADPSNYEDFTTVFNGLSAATPYYYLAYVQTGKATQVSMVGEFQTTKDMTGYFPLGDIGVARVNSGKLTSLDNARGLCAGNGTGGYTDWRLPTSNEMMSIYNNRYDLGELFLGDDPRYWFENAGATNSFGYVDLTEGTTATLLTPGDRLYRVRCVRTLPCPPEVETMEAKNIKDRTATVFGRITDMGKPECHEYGFYVGNERFIADNIGKDGVFSIELDGLQPSTTYYYSAFARNTENEDEGYRLKFETYQLPVVTTYGSNSIIRTSATLEGNVYYGTMPYDEFGFYYGRSPGVTTDNTRKLYDGNAERGNYSVKLSDLEKGTLYYYRAYAKNAAGYTWGEEMSFRTSYDIVTSGKIDIMGFDLYAKMSQDMAETACGIQDLGGYNNWRLPSYDEVGLIASVMADLNLEYKESYWTNEIDDRLHGYFYVNIDGLTRRYNYSDSVPQSVRCVRDRE